MTYKYLYIYIAFFGVLLLTACSTPENDGHAESGSEDMHIISLMPSNTEIIAELGAAESLAGITTADNYPEDLDENLTRFDSFELDEEMMTALNPTHIVSHESGHDGNQDIIDRVALNTGAEVLVVDDAQKISEIYTTITDIGAFIGKESEADSLNNTLQQEVAEIQAQYENQDDTALVLISTQPDIYIAGNNTFIDDFLQTLSINNTFSDIEGYPSITSEELIERVPDTVISTLGISSEALTAELNSITGLQDAAITLEENQCTPNPDIISRPGPRFTEGLAAIAECVYE